MTINEFNREFDRLEKHFRVNQDDRAQILKDWFKALSHYHVDAVSTAIDDVIQSATDTFWPALGKITGAIKSKLARYEQTRRACPKCNGNTWVEAMPWKSNGIVYEGFTRCSECGVPPPNYTPPPYREELTATEYAQYLHGTLPQPEIPIARTHPLVAQALRAIRPMGSQKPIAQDVNVAKVFSEPGEGG